MLDRKNHWENIYSNQSNLNVSWYQQKPVLSLAFIERCQLSLNAPIIDVGGGASTLVDHLCETGYTNLSVLDISVNALNNAKKRLAHNSTNIKWHERDILTFKAEQRYSLWHDRAVFHFLTHSIHRKKYVNVLKQSLQPGGSFIIAAFAIGGSTKCSNLNIVQYDENKIMSELGSDFKLIETDYEIHTTPANKQQKFEYFRFKYYK